MPRKRFAGELPPSDLLKSSQAEELLDVTRTGLQRAREHMLTLILPRVPSEKTEQTTHMHPRLYTEVSAAMVAAYPLNTPLDQIRKLSRAPEVAIPLIKRERQQLADRLGDIVVDNMLPVAPLAHIINVAPTAIDRWSAGGALEKVRQGRYTFVPIDELEKFEWQLPLELRDEPDLTAYSRVL